MSSSRRAGSGLRELADPFVVAAPSGARIETRLRVSARDVEVLTAVGSHLGSLAGRDLAVRCRAGLGVDGKAGKHLNRADRKRALTAESSSRWAGTITRVSADQWQRARSNQFDHARGLRQAITTIEARLAAPVGGRTDPKDKPGRRGRRTVRGYASQGERAQKQRRLQKLRTELASVEADLAAGRVNIVRGGRRLANTRHHLDDAGLTADEWQDRWAASRLFLTADGEADALWGNQTIRVHPDEGWVEVRLPGPLAGLSNTPGRAPTYRLDLDGAGVSFAHRGDQWAAQAATGAVRYDIRWDPTRGPAGRWYLAASWSTTPGPAPDLDDLRSHRTLGVDLNDGHFACWVIDPAGNPVGDPHTVTVGLTGSTSTRDGRLRQAVTAICDLAEVNGCRSVTIEDLDFDDARTAGRETMGRGRRGKKFRRTVAGIPTARFRDRLAGMAHNRGLAVIAVDRAYTSIWGARHWHKPLQHTTTTTGGSKNSTGERPSRHHAAAVVIGRRGLGHRARRRVEKPGPHQQDETPGNHHPDRTAATEPPEDQRPPGRPAPASAGQDGTAPTVTAEPSGAPTPFGGPRTGLTPAR